MNFGEKLKVIHTPWNYLVRGKRQKCDRKQRKIEDLLKNTARKIENVTAHNNMNVQICIFLSL
jgi:hypothetical protein